MGEAILFYLFAFLLVFSALMVVTGRNTVHGVLFLILAFINAAGLFLLMRAELLAMMLVIVYVGAVAVLFLFVVMMLDVNAQSLKEGFQKHKAIGMLVWAILLTELMMTSFLWKSHPAAAFSTSDISNAQALGRVLYTDYLVIFQLSGLVLLVAMIGAIVLTLRRRGNMRRQNISEQLKRTPENSIEMKKVDFGQGVRGL